MVDWLAIWGVSALSVFRPILEDIAKDVAKDAAKSYVAQCFKNVFSVIYKEPLTKATGQALKELLQLIEDELIRADIEGELLQSWVNDVRRFVKQESVRDAIAALFLQPDYHLDPKIFITAWQQLDGALAMPEGFSWPYVAKRFAAKVVAIRQSSTELQETFTSLAQAQDTHALQELAGLPPEFDLETYREALVERYGTVDLASLDTTGAYYEVRLWSVFVAQSVRECHEYDPQLLEVPKDQLLRLVEAGELDAAQLEESEKLHDERRKDYINQTPKPVLAVTDDAAIPRQVILGDPGSGKSSLLRYLALQWARINDANQRYTQPLPLLIELREYNRWHCPSHKGFLKYLHEASTWHRLNQQTLKHLLGQPNRVLLLLDGLDEVFDPAEREQVVNDIHRFSNEYKQVRMVVTSRVVGYQPHRLRNAEFRHFMLQDLDDDQIGIFLDRWHEVTFDRAQKTEAENKRERLEKAIINSKSIRQLAGNPLLLTMMAVLNRHQELPRDRVDLYQQCSRLLLYQWDMERALGDFPGLSAEIGLREKTEILRVVAYAMQTRVSDKSRANYIDGNTLTELIEDYLCTKLRFEQARAVARALVQQLRKRNFILCFLGADSYAFVHRTFLEYFCAAEIVQQFNVAKTLEEQGLIDLFDKHCRDDDWHEVLRLICGQIDETFVSQVVDNLTMLTPKNEWHIEKAMPEISLALYCLSEVRSTSKLSKSATKLFERILDVYQEHAGNNVNKFRESLLNASRELVGVFSNSYTDINRILAVAKSFGESQEDGGIVAIGLNFPSFVANALNSREALEKMIGTTNPIIQSQVPKILIERWSDESTHSLLVECATQNHFIRLLRSTALQALAEKWPDETTRTFLTQRAVDDEHEALRSAALLALAKKWPDETTRTFLTQRAVDDEHEALRS
ncbi:MAG: NACHT domain-containing protein, partial [Cyanobacteria bacterium J06597_1]